MMPLLKKITYSALLITLLQFSSNAQIVLNEVLSDGTIELKNQGTTTVNVSGYYLCTEAECIPVSSIGAICPFPPPGDLEPNEIMYGLSGIQLLTGMGDLALFSSDDVTNPDAMVDYVQWGAENQAYEDLAIQAGLWASGEFTDSIIAEGSIEYDGIGDSASDWSRAFAYSPCNENGTGCDVIAGVLSGDEPTVCVTDSMPDYVFVGFGQLGAENYLWLVTNQENDTIEAIVEGDFIYDFEGSLPGISEVWMLGYIGTPLGVEVGNHIDDIEGCIDFSNEPFVVTKIDCFSSTKNKLQPSEIGLTLSPNPAFERLFMAFNSDQFILNDVRIFDFTGKEILSFSHIKQSSKDSLELNINHLQSGLYLVVLEGNKGVVCEKYIKK